MQGKYVEVRHAKVDDLDAIFSIEQGSFPDPYPRGLLKAFFFMPGAYLVAVACGEIVGYAVGIIRYSAIGHIVSIAVRAEYRRKGIGRMLLCRLIEELAALGAREMQLEVRESNSSAIALYVSVGFQRKMIIERYYEDGESALSMTLTWRRRPRRLAP